MTLNNFIEAIAGKLAGVWPDRKVYVDEIPKDADGQFFVGIIESGQEAHLDRRRKRSIQIEVLYFLKSKENMEFNAWAEEMYDQFETLTVKETDQKTRTIRLTNQRARPDKNARVYQFTFDADFFFVLTPAELHAVRSVQSADIRHFRLHVSYPVPVALPVRCIRCRLPGRHHPGAELPLGKGHCRRYAADFLLCRQPDGR